MGNKVQGIIELSGKEINNEIVCTTGFQITKVLQVIKEDLLNCIWYCGDISTNYNMLNDSSKSRKEYFKLEDTEQLMKFAMQIDQFLSGVFLAIPKSICHPNLEYNFDTERESTTDLGDAILEIRAFDTSFFEFYSSRTEITERLTEYFKA